MSDRVTRLILRHYLQQSEGRDVIQLHAIINFVYAANNVPTGSLIDQVWPHLEQPAKQHLFALFVECDYYLLGFLFRLDDINRAILVKWIMDNYSSYSIPQAQLAVKRRLLNE